MAKWIAWTEGQKELYAAWIAERPQCIRDMVERYNLSADELYVLKTTGQRVTLHSLDEDGTVQVNVLPEYNTDLITGIFGLGRRVFGINPADLEPCECPIPVVDGATILDTDDD